MRIEWVREFTIIKSYNHYKAHSQLTNIYMANNANKAVNSKYLGLMLDMLKRWESTTVYGTRNVGEVRSNNDGTWFIHRFSSIKETMHNSFSHIHNGYVRSNLHLLKECIMESCERRGKLYPHVDINGHMRIDELSDYGLEIVVEENNNQLMSNNHIFRVRKIGENNSISLGTLNRDITETFTWLPEIAGEHGITIERCPFSILIKGITLTGLDKPNLGCNVELIIG